MKRTFWIINQYASTPETSFGGRHFYLAREMAKQGHNVYVIAASYTHLLRSEPEVNGNYTQQVIDGVNYIWIKTRSYSEAHSKKRIINWFLFAWKLLGLRKIIKDKPECILYSSPSLVGFLGARMLSRKLNCKLAFEVRDIWPLTLMQVGGYASNHPFIRFLQWIEDTAYRDSDIVISNLKNSVEHMVERGLESSKFRWVANGFSKDEVSNILPISEDVDAQIPKGKFIVGYAGTLGKANSLDILIEAASDEALSTKEDLAFVLVGDGKEKSELKGLVAQKKLNNVYFVDSVPKTQVQSILNKFDVCFIGLAKEPLFKYGVSPNKLFDYFYSAKPIVYAIESGKYTPVMDAKAGFEIPAGDADSITQTVLKLYEMDESEREALGSNGHKYACNHHEYGALASKLVKSLQ